MGQHAVRLMLRLVVIIVIMLPMMLGGGLNVRPDGRLYIGSNVVLAAGEGWLGTWQDRIEIKVDYSKIESTLTNFPAPIHLSSSSGANSADLTAVFDELTTDANRKKIAVTTSNGTTQCYVEIESWDDANEQAWLWVKIPIVNFGSDTILYLYYDSVQPDNTSYVGDTGSTPAKNVWKSDFEGVWHLEGNYDGTANEVLDSTTNEMHGTGGGGTESQCPVKIASKIGYGQYFGGDADCDPPDGNDAYITFGNHDAFSVTTTDELMYEVWVDFTSLNFYINQAANHDAWYLHVIGIAQPYQEEWLLVIGGANGDNPYSIRNYLMDLGGGLGASADTTWQWQVGDKVHVYGWIDNVTEMMNIEVWYPNGLYTIYSDPYTGEVTPGSSDSPLTLGGECEGDSYGQWWEGTFDEFRVMSANQTTAWRKANHFAQTDELLAYDYDAVFASRHEYYHDDNDNASFGGVIWVGQTFTPEISHTIKEVRWKLNGTPTPSGNVTCAIYAVDGNHKPTGSALSTGSIPASYVRQLSNGVHIYTIEVSGANLAAGTEYAAVLYALDVSNAHYSYYTDTSGEYSGGYALYSGSSGGSWSVYSARDDYFEEWGIS